MINDRVFENDPLIMKSLKRSWNDAIPWYAEENVRQIDLFDDIPGSGHIIK